MYDTGKKPTDEDLAERLAYIDYINKCWSDIIGDCYGEKVGEKLKKIAPADPFILYDLSATSLMREGMSDDEARETVDNFDSEDWERELNGFRETITELVDKANKQIQEQREQTIALKTYYKK